MLRCISSEDNSASIGIRRKPLYTFVDRRRSPGKLDKRTRRIRRGGISIYILSQYI